MIFTKEDSSTSDEQVVVLYREDNIHYRYCVGLLIYILSTRVGLCFAIWSNRYSIGVLEYNGSLVW